MLSITMRTLPSFLKDFGKNIKESLNALKLKVKIVGL
jgi:hypothetical protein